jgi:hypothetical protein
MVVLSISDTPFLRFFCGRTDNVRRCENATTVGMSCQIHAGE